MLKEGEQLKQLFNERLVLLEKAIEAVKKYKEINTKYINKKFEFNMEYGYVELSDTIINNFEVKPKESDLWRAIQ